MTRKELLIGELVGLARATDGNEHLISDSATELICLVLRTPETDVSDTVYAQLSEQITQIKRAMVPDCFHCASPCGRTSAYDLDSIDRLPVEQKEFKNQLLKDLYTAALRPQSSDILYKGLILLGMEDCPQELKAFWNQLID